MDENFIITEIKRIVLVGQDEYPEKVTAFPAPSSQELIYHFSGEADVLFDEYALYTAPNTIRYLPLEGKKRYIVDRKTRGECIDICFLSNKPLFDRPLMIDVKNERLAPLFKKAFSLWVQKGEEYYLESLSVVYKIIAEMRKTSYLPDGQFQKLKPAIDYIQERFLSAEPITAEGLVNVCGISYSYIKKLFQLKYKTSPKRYVISLKMNYASDLLRHGEHTVSQIAELCGYSDIYTFSHQFKLEIGLSPTAFYKKYKSSK